MDDIGKHIANLNLFVESDGNLYLTVTGGNALLAGELASLRGFDGTGKPPFEAVMFLAANAHNLTRPTQSKGTR